MTHNIQIGINVDDDSIANGVKKAAIQEIQKGMFGHILDYNWGSVTFSREFAVNFLSDYFAEIVNNEAFREMLAKYTAEMLAERLIRSAKFKDKVANEVYTNAAEG